MNDQVTDHLPHEIKAARNELEMMYDRDDWTGEEVATHCRHIKEVRSPELYPWSIQAAAPSEEELKRDRLLDEAIAAGKAFKDAEWALFHARSRRDEARRAFEEAVGTTIAW